MSKVKIGLGGAREQVGTYGEAEKLRKLNSHWSEATDKRMMSLQGCFHFLSVWIIKSGWEHLTVGDFNPEREVDRMRKQNFSTDPV